MIERFTSEKISKVLDQTLAYQCACPAQVCKAILELRELYAYQLRCAANPANEDRVHAAIVRATEIAHGAMEDCLEEVLMLEQWNPQTLEMPHSLRGKPVKPI